MAFADMSCAEFVDALASKQPVPGGGGASALVGAIGVALGNMVGSLTVGKPKYADAEADLIKLKEEADTLQSSLLELVERDAEAFAPLAQAYGMPTDTDIQKAEKAHVMEECLRACSAVPLEIMERCAEGIALLEQFAEKGATFAISDIGCGAYCCMAALESAGANVFINAKLMQDREYASELCDKAHGIISKNKAKTSSIISTVISYY